MTEFTQTMKDWHRMCKAMTEKNSYDACISCPLEYYGCPAVYEGFDTYKDVNFEAVGERIAEWAAEHPVVYPTWGAWLSKTYGKPSSILLSEEIPTDIAEKLGIEPKEG